MLVALFDPVRLQEEPHMIYQANMYKSNARLSLKTSQIVQNALLNNKGILSDHMGSLLQSDRTDPHGIHFKPYVSCY